MPGLHTVLGVLKHDLNEIMQAKAKCRGPEDITTIARISRNTVPSENPTNIEVIGKLQRSIRHNIGDTVDCITLLSVDHWCRTGKHQ